MKIWQRINLMLFFVFVVVTCTLVYLSQKTSMSTAFEKPWHLQPSVHEDSLSQNYKDNYKIFGRRPLFTYFNDSLTTRVAILVDAWGVPNDESILAEDLMPFIKLPHTFALHQRLANRTRHAERTEFRNSISSNMYVFGGDSTEYNRQDYIREIGFSQAFYCQHCSDSLMLAKMDSLLTLDTLRFIAWTTQSSRTGDRDSLRYTLQLIAKFAERYPNIMFVIQGTHRPILGTPENRNGHKAHWVPVVILNYQGKQDD